MGKSDFLAITQGASSVGQLLLLSVYSLFSDRVGQFTSKKEGTQFRPATEFEESS